VLEIMTLEIMMNFEESILNLKKIDSLWLYNCE